jgi:guanylate kinase
MNKYKIIAICGKSAAGKDTFLHEIIKQNPEVHEVVSCTTRPPREGEEFGKNYFFLTPEEFSAKADNNEMLETSGFRDWLYGTSYEGLNSNLINAGVFNPEGICSLLHNHNVDLYVVMVQASNKARLLRSLYREKNPDVDEIVRRY